MKLIRKSGEGIILHLGNKEKELFCAVLQCYPRMPRGHQRLARPGQVPDGEEAQRLLDEALDYLRTDSKKYLSSLLSEQSGGLRRQGEGWALEVRAEDMELILGILNDVRVGSWVLLGSPEGRITHLSADTAPNVWAMEMAGYFQMHLLSAAQDR